MEQDLQSLDEFTRDLEEKAIKWVALGHDFTAYCENLGVKYDSTIAESLTGDNQFIYIDKTHIDMVYAWTAWVMTYRAEKSLVWLKNKWKEDSPLLRVAGYLSSGTGTKANVVRRDDNKIADLFSQTTFTTLIPHPSAICGLSISHLIVDYCGMESPEWNTLMAAILPVMSHDKKIITLG